MEREWTCPVKIMNWGYWGSVGVVAEEIYQQKMAQAGIGSIEGPEEWRQWTFCCHNRARN
ncbi:hypothetical protein KQR57_05175 [Bacillus inaquosorum]|nr:hypothetical protein [Bacillus inaquosorum]